MDRKIAIGIAVNMLGGNKTIGQLGKMSKQAKGVGSAFSGMKAAIGTAAITAGIGKIVSAFGDLESAKAEIASLGIGDAGISQITAAATKFSSTWAGTTRADFIRASYDIKSGISSLSDEAVGEFTRMAALTGKATKSNTAEMTNLFATGYGIYREQFGQFGKDYIKGWSHLSKEERDIKFGAYFSAGISSSVQAFKTTGPQMSAALSNLGAEATSAGIKFSEQLAILGQLQATMSGSEAATKYRAFLQSAYKASGKLGLEFTNINGKLKSMPQILEEIKLAYGDTLDAQSANELKEAFGTDEAVGLIKLLLPQVDRLKNNTSLMQAELTKGMQKTNEMAKNMERGPNKQLQKLGQIFTMTAQDVGKHFAPQIGKAITAVEWFTNATRRFIATHPQVLDQIGMGVVGFGALVGVTLAAKSAAFAFNGVMTIGRALMVGYHATVVAVRLGMVAFNTAMGLAKVATLAFNTALIANPIGLVVTAVVGATALIYAHWEPVSAFFSGVWTRIKEPFKVAWGWIVSSLGFNPIESLSKTWGTAGEWFGKLVNTFKAPFVRFFDWLKEKFAWFSEAIGKIKGIAANVLGAMGIDITNSKPIPKIGTKSMSASNNADYTPAMASHRVGVPLYTMPTSTKPISKTQDVKVQISFGDIVVQSVDNKIDSAALHKQIQSTVEDAVRRALESNNYKMEDVS